MRVYHAIDVGPCGVYCAMDDITRLVVLVTVIRVEQLVAVEINADHARGRHLFVEQAVGVDQKFIMRSGHAHRDVIGDVIGHLVEIHQAVGSGEIDARLPFCSTHLRAHRCGRRLLHGLAFGRRLCSLRLRFFLAG